MGIIDKFDDTVRLNLRRFGLTALPLFSVTVALNAPLEVALLCGTSCSALALMGSRPAKIRPTVGRQMYRTAQYLLANFAPFAENSTIKPCLLFAMQLDGLDAWRARFGREATRTLLQHAYDRINGALRNDDVVVHTSDHQFYALVVVNDLCDLAATLAIGNRLQKAIDPGFQIDGRSHYFSLSVGIADSRHYPQVTAKRLVRSANSALNRARYSGDGQMRLFSPDMDQNAKSKPRVTSPALRTALYDRKIRAWFQPQICAKSGQILGFEALARWEQGDGTQIPPLEFLHVLESSGQMRDMTDNMIADALKSWTWWKSAGWDIPHVSVNLSPDDLADPDLPKRVEWMLDNFKVPAKVLCLEIVENVIAQDANDVCVSNIKCLSEMGCKIDLDDFGTGHASITSIRHFKVDRIKIDRSFVTKCDQDPAQSRLANAMIQMAQQLDLEVVAEGVETIGEQCHMVDLGVDALQGYSIAHPLAPEKVVAWMEGYFKKQRRKAAV